MNEIVIVGHRPNPSLLIALSLARSCVEHRPPLVIDASTPDQPIELTHEVVMTLGDCDCTTCLPPTLKPSIPPKEFGMKLRRRRQHR
jgi:hypothetical protein